MFICLFLWCLGDERQQWSSTPISVRTAEQNGSHSALSTPSTISPAPDTGPEEDSAKMSSSSNDYEKTDGQKNIKEYSRYVNVFGL